MKIVSESLVNSIIEEKHREAARMAQAQQAIRRAKAKRRDESQNAHPEKSFWQTFKSFVKDLWLGSDVSHVTIDSKDKQYRPDAHSISPDDLILSEKRRLYERIALGNALADAELLSKKMRGGQE